MLGRDLGLNPAPAATVTGDDNFAGNVHPILFEHFVIRRGAVVHIDHLTGDISVSGVSVVGRSCSFDQTRSRICSTGGSRKLAVNRVGAVISESLVFGIGKEPNVLI